jgi:hypothetical protein
MESISHYLAIVAVYPVFSDFYNELRKDFLLDCVNDDSKGDIYAAWHNARASLKGNYFTHYENGFPVDAHNNIHWYLDANDFNAIERHGKFHLKFSRIGESEMLQALTAYNGK